MIGQAVKYFRRVNNIIVNLGVVGICFSKTRSYLECNDKISKKCPILNQLVDSSCPLIGNSCAK